MVAAGENLPHEHVNQTMQSHDFRSQRPPIDPPRDDTLSPGLFRNAQVANEPNSHDKLRLPAIDNQGVQT